MDGWVPWLGLFGVKIVGAGLQKIPANSCDGSEKPSLHSARGRKIRQPTDEIVVYQRFRDPAPSTLSKKIVRVLRFGHRQAGGWAADIGPRP